MVDGGSWDASGRYRSQSVSDEQWSQLLAAQGHAQAPPPPDTLSGRQRFNTASNTGGNARACLPGRGMMSSTSVGDLNTLVQQPQQQQHQHQMMPHMGGMHQVSCFHS